MKIGVPKEIKPQENRIGLTPDSVKQLTSNGHEVLVENDGGFEAGFENEHYISSGAKIINKAEDIFKEVFDKEPPASLDFFRDSQGYNIDTLTNYGAVPLNTKQITNTRFLLSLLHS